MSVADRRNGGWPPNLGVRASDRLSCDLIADGRTHVCDGAMGTMLYARGVFLNVCYDELNPEAAGSGARDSSRVCARWCGADRDQHVRRQSPQARRLWSRVGDREDQRGCGAAGPRGRARAAPWSSVPLDRSGVRIEPFGELAVHEARRLSPDR